MLCEICHDNQVSFVISMTTDSSAKAVRVCEECATSRFSEDRIADTRRISAQRKCPRCESIYSPSALMGCPTCYTEFRKELTSDLRHIHGNTIHIGKRLAG